MAIRGFHVLLTLAAASCSDEAGSASPSRVPTNARAPAEPRRAAGPRAERPFADAPPPAKAPGAASPAIAASAEPRRAQPPVVTLETLALRTQALARNRFAGTAALAAAIQEDEALVRATIRLLLTSDDVEMLAGVGGLAAAGAFDGHLALVRDDLLMALGTPGPAERRIAAHRALVALEEPLSDGTTVVVVGQLGAETDARAITALGESDDGVLTPEMRAALLICASRLHVPTEATPRDHPARGARREAYALIARDAVLRNDWEALVVRAGDVPTASERADIIDALARVRLRKDDAPLADGAAANARRAWFARLYRLAEEPGQRVLLVLSGRDPLRCLALSDKAPEDERRATAVLLRELIASEVHELALAALRGALASFSEPK